MLGLDLYEMVRARMLREGVEWPPWSDLSADERAAWCGADEDAYETYTREAATVY